MPAARDGSAGLTVRAARAGDAADVRALTAPELDRSRYGSGARSAIETALRAADAESRALVGADGGRIVGIIVYGTIAGSVGTGRFQLVITDAGRRRRGIATALVNAAVASLVADGSRVLFVELPDDPALADAKHLLFRAAFRVEASVADYFSDGVDLLVLRRDLV